MCQHGRTRTPERCSPASRIGLGGPRFCLTQVPLNCFFFVCRHLGCPICKTLVEQEDSILPMMLQHTTTNWYFRASAIISDASLRVVEWSLRTLLWTAFVNAGLLDCLRRSVINAIVTQLRLVMLFVYWICSHALKPHSCR